ncbi:cyanophycinase [candidate division KSB1 bacterium]|nr:cyanophycinase [candidate division KSB1 bacterium]
MKLLKFMFINIFILLIACQSSDAPRQKGWLLIIGGAGRSDSAVNAFMQRAGDGKILVLTSASGVPEKSGPEAVTLFRDAGAKNVEWLHIAGPDTANADTTLRHFQGVSAVYITGGVQSRFMDRIGGTKTEQQIKKIYFEEKGIIAGTSAGAAIMSEIMITGDGDFAVLDKDNIVTAPGLGLLENCIIVQHFVARQRNNRLLSKVIETGLPGIGIDETTAILVEPDDTFTVFGPNSIMVYDPRPGKILKAHKTKLSATGIRLSVLVDGQRFDLKDGTLISTPQLQ